MKNNSNTITQNNNHIYIQPVICRPRRKIGFSIDPLRKKDNHNNYKLKCQVSNAKEIDNINNEIQISLRNKQKAIDDKKKEQYDRKN